MRCRTTGRAAEPPAASCALERPLRKKTPTVCLEPDTELAALRPETVALFSPVWGMAARLFCTQGRTHSREGDAPPLEFGSVSVAVPDKLPDSCDLVDVSSP